MREEDIYEELRASLTVVGLDVPPRAGFIPRDWQAKKANAAPPKARPDYTFIAPPPAPGGVIEVKYHETNLAFAEVDRQRDWLDSHPQLSRWLWISLGLGRERETWLVEWEKWKSREADFRRYGLAGMAHLQPRQIAHREMGLYASWTLDPWRLIRAKGKIWIIPEHHPFYDRHILPHRQLYCNTMEVRSDTVSVGR